MKILLYVVRFTSNICIYINIVFDMCNYTFLSKDWLQSLSLGHYTAALLEWCEAGDAIQSVAKRLCGSLKEVKKR